MLSPVTDMSLPSILQVYLSLLCKDPGNRTWQPTLATTHPNHTTRPPHHATPIRTSQTGGSATWVSWTGRFAQQSMLCCMDPVIKCRSEHPRPSTHTTGTCPPQPSLLLAAPTRVKALYQADAGLPLQQAVVESVHLMSQRGCHAHACHHHPPRGRVAAAGPRCRCRHLYCQPRRSPLAAIHGHPLLACRGLRMGRCLRAKLVF